MKPRELKERLVGVIAFCPTPFDETLALNPEGLALQVEYLCDSGATAIVVCGGVGEYYALDLDEHRTIVDTAVQAANGRLPVIVGIGAATGIAERLAEQAAAAGAAGILVNPLPFVQPSRRGLRAHYEAICAASGLGTIVFLHRQAAYDLPTLCELAEVDGVVGVKDELADLGRFVRARAEIGERFAWINGTGEALAAPYSAAGAQAFTSGIVNFAPQLTLAVWRESAEGRLDEVRTLVERYIQPITNMRAKPGYSTTVVKEAMTFFGRPAGAARPPLVPLDTAERAELTAILEPLRSFIPTMVPLHAESGR